jgi:isopenicillin-N epimerase
MEREPVRFLVDELEGCLDEARSAVATLVGADPDDLAFCPNATTAVNAVLRSLDFSRGDELVVTDHAYNACRNVLDYVAARAGARVVVARVLFPLVKATTTWSAPCVPVLMPRTQLAPRSRDESDGRRLPDRARWSRCRRARRRHASSTRARPGMLPLSICAIGAAYYTGNLHKWCCAPKGATAFLYVRRDRQAGQAVDDQPRRELAARGSLALPSRVRLDRHLRSDGRASVAGGVCFIASLVPGGWPAVMARNRALAREARQEIVTALGAKLPCPDAMIGTLAALELPDARTITPPASSLYTEPLHRALEERHRIQVPIVPWPEPPRRLVRISAHLYNRIDEYRRLGAALRDELARE